MIVVGIDGGMIRLGLAAVEITEDSFDLVSYDLLSTPRGEGKYNAFLTEGITKITNQFPRFLNNNRPDIIFSETIPAGKLGANDSQVIAAVTTCHVLAVQWGIPWIDIAASTVKKSLTDDGRATKTQVRNFVLDNYPELREKHIQEKVSQKKEGLKKRPGLAQDYFDAVAVAIAGAMRVRSLIMELNDEEKALQEVQKT